MRYFYYDLLDFLFGFIGEENQKGGKERGRERERGGEKTMAASMSMRSAVQPASSGRGRAGAVRRSRSSKSVVRASLSRKQGLWLKGDNVKVPSTFR